MKKVLKFVKGRKEEKRECGGVSPSVSGELLTPAQTPEEDGTSGVENGYGYSLDFGGKDKTLTKLHKAAWQGNLEKLKSALKKVEVDAVDKHNRTALHLAVAQGHPNIVWFLLGNNAKTSVIDDQGHSPLLKAIECGHKECMTLLLDRGADVNVADYTGNTALHIAVTRASLDTVSALLNKSADTELRNNAGDYPLHIATRLENKDLVDLLLGAGASVDVLDRENRTPLMLAAKTGNSVLTQLFVERGAQLSVVDSNGWTAQDYAMLGGHEHIASSFGQSQAKTEAKPPQSDPPSSSSWGDTQTDTEPKPAAPAEPGQDDSPGSPDAEVIPPYCQPPRSWEIIQAGMIDPQKNGTEPKRRSITALGTLHSRRESFTDAPSAVSPKSTLSLNRRRQGKEHNAFAKHRLSLNEAESLCHWLEEDRKEKKKGQSGSESDWDSVSACTESAQGSDGSGTLGRRGTMLGVEEMWVSNAQVSCSPEEEKAFPPPPTGLELGVDMAKSIRRIRGLSVDQGRDRNLWKNAYESHSLDCLEEKEHPETKPGDAIFRCQKPKDRLTDVSRRINEQLECYDQALRELASESSRETDGGKYYSLPRQTGGRDEWRRMSCRGLPAGPAGEKLDKESKRHMLLAMRDIKHGPEMAKNFRTSMDEDILSPLGKPEDSFDDDKSSPKGMSSSSGGNSPPDENPFFGVGRQETVLERSGRESDGSGTGEESTLWLQDSGQRKENSDEDVPEIGVDEGTKYGRSCSFSPLGVIQREMEEESRGREQQRSGENEDHNEVVQEQSPDVSLSSGPIEPLGADKDSGSEPESSHNDISPSRTYALKSQHEWLRCHLRAATTEKSKLEELTAELTEKAERLQYELADAKEAAKSRDEVRKYWCDKQVIHLLQGQLARMEAAYTKSLEESVQSRLLLTSHEQEILHLKELCYRYQEEKEAAGSGSNSDFLQELQLRIKVLEEEKEKMRAELSQLEQEKSILESEMREQCQRWKERCQRLEEMVAAYESKQAALESYVTERETKQHGLELEKRLMEAREENAGLRARVESLGAMAERERKRASEAEEEKQELRGELKKRKAELESEMRKLEKDMEEKMVRKLKEKEEEVGGLVAQFRRERDLLAGGGARGEEWRREERKERGLEGKRGAAGREGELAWRSLYGMEGGRRRSGGGRMGVGDEEGMKEGIIGSLISSEVIEKPEVNVHEMEFVELKRQILSLESKMSDEKNLRHALENEIMKMRMNLNEKENLEMEVDALKRKMSFCQGKPEVELVAYERDLQAKRERYLGNDASSTPPREEFKAKCEILAKEREKAKQLSKSLHRKTLASPPEAPVSPPLQPYSRPQLLLQPRQVTLHPDVKSNLNYELDKSIRKYMQESAPSTST